MIGIKKTHQQSFPTKFLPLSLALVMFAVLCLTQNYKIFQYQSKGFGENSDSFLNTIKILPNLGWQNLIADFLWLRFAQYNGDFKNRRKTGNKLSYTYLKEITRRDPHFEKAYLMANLAVASKMGRPDLAEELLAEGVIYNPKAYTIWQYRGFLHFMYTGNYKLAAFSFQENAGWAVAEEGNAKQAWGNKWLTVAKYLEGNDPGLWLRRKVWQDIVQTTATADSEALVNSLKQLNALGVVVDSKGEFRELYPAPMPEAFLSRFVYGPLSPQE